MPRGGHPGAATVLLLGLWAWTLSPVPAFAQPAPLPGGRPYPDNAYLSPPPPTPDDAVMMSVMLTDGRTLAGTIVGGNLTVQTVFGTRDIEAIHLRSLSDHMLALDDGFTHSGSVTILKGVIQLKTAAGVVAIPAAGIRTMHGALTFTSPDRPGQSAGPGGPDAGADARHVIIGKWRDSQSTAWEFFQDGTMLMRRQLSGHYTFVDSHHLKIDVWMFGMQMAQVYEVLDAGPDRIVLRLQGAQPLTLQRVP